MANVERPDEAASASLGASQPANSSGARYCIIGAGSSGLPAAKNLQQLGMPFDVIEREDGVGGNWYYGRPNRSFGKPVDQVGETLLDLNVPLSVRRVIGKVTYNVAVGDLSRYGAQRPDHKLFETHPIVNAQLPYFIAHGDVISKPDIRELDGDTVVFVDG